MKLKYKVLCGGDSLVTANHISTKSTIDRAIRFCDQRAKTQRLMHWVQDGDTNQILWTSRDYRANYS